ncbi:hypothetical protein [Delftia tsuruhatensis]|uniref:hypothetical protein n=1 Tax=Delftia tsuruhatensis TaxID=180282 RepID=UPI003AF0AD9F
MRIFSKSYRVGAIVQREIYFKIKYALFTFNFVAGFPSQLAICIKNTVFNKTYSRPFCN